MKRILCALLVLRVATGHSIVTKSMLYGEDEPPMEMVPLVTPEPDVPPTSARTSRIRETPKELLRSLGYVRADDDFQGRDMSESEVDVPERLSTEYDDYYGDTTPPYTTSFPEVAHKKYQIQRRLDTLTVNQTAQNSDYSNPVRRLWETTTTSEEPSTVTSSLERTMPPRPMPGFMAILDAAFSCLWSGLGFECFSLKVVPMFRAMMGFPPVNPFGHPYYVLPRTSDVDDDDEEVDEQGRRRRRRLFGLKLIKGAMIGLAAMKGLVLPTLSALSIVSGKAIVFSLIAIVLAIAAGWSNARSADRRVYDYSGHQENTPYYM